MPKTKTLAEPQSGPTLTQQPAQPEKQSGPNLAGLLQRAVGGLPPPDGTLPAARIASMLAIPHMGGATHRARTLRALQGKVGNARVGRLLGTTVQTKLTVNTPGDIYEQEADRVADQVMRMPEPRIQRQVEPEEEETLQTKPLAAQITPLVQRQVEAEEEEEEPSKAEEELLQAKPLAGQVTPLIQRQTEFEEEEEPVQAKLTEDAQLQRQEEVEEEKEPLSLASVLVRRQRDATTEPLQAQATPGEAPEVTPDVEDHISTSKGGGEPLAGSVRTFAEPRFGADFSRVRVHTDAQSNHVARALNAQAFTTGQDIYFGAGQYQPGTKQGNRLLAHELTHVAQQKGIQGILSTVQRDETKGITPIQGQINKDKPGPVTDKSSSQFTLTVNEPPPGKHYYFRWSARDARDNAYLMRSVDDDAVVQGFGNSKHAYLNTPSLNAMLDKGAGLGCRVLCRVIETDSPVAPRPFHRITENSRVFSLSFDFLPPPNLEKIETVFEHLSQGKWDVDTLAAKLTDSEMMSLELSKRVSLVSYIAEGNLVGDEDETTIIRLISTTPSKDTKALFDNLNADNAKLYKRLEKVIDGEEYRKYHQTLYSKFPETMEPEEALQKTELAGTLPWADPGIIHSFWNRRFVYDDVSINEKGKIHIEYWHTILGMGLKYEVNRDLDPNELIGVHFYFQEEEVGAPKGKTLYMPAVNFLSLYQKQFRQEWSLIGNVALLGLGGMGLIGAATKLGKVIAALELAFAVASITIDEFRSEIAETEAGKAFLKVWDKVSFVVQAYGMARVALKLPGVFKGLKEAFKDFKGSQPKLKPGDLTKVEDSVNDVLKKADDAIEQGQATAQTETPGTQTGKPTTPEVEKPPELEKPAEPGKAPKVPEGKAPETALTKALTHKQQKLREVAIKLIGKFKKAKDYHGLTRHNMQDPVVKGIMSEPDGIYLTQDSRIFIFHKGGDVAVVEATGSARGNIITAYGSSGIKGPTGAKAIGGLPSEPGLAVTAEMIEQGKIPTPGGGFMPPATKIWP